MKMPKCMPWVVVGLFAASLRGESASSTGSTRLDAVLGLVPEDTYTALEKDGCACDPGAPAMRQTAKNK